MTTAQLIIVCATALIGLSVLVTGYPPTRRGKGPLHGQLITVHTRKPDDQSVHGRCIGDHDDRIRLADAEYVQPGGGRSIPDLVTIFRENVAWLQEHEDKEVN